LKPPSSEVLSTSGFSMLIFIFSFTSMSLTMRIGSFWGCQVPTTWIANQLMVEYGDITIIFMKVINKSTNIT
jgi:hypothetical protein